MLDTTIFEKALIQLQTAVEKAAGAKREQDMELYGIFCTACIKAFEYSYELSIKMLKRGLKTMDLSSDTVEKLPFRELMRVGAEKGFIEHPENWFSYRKQRNETVHGYHEETAEEIYSKLVVFLKDAEFMLAQLKKIAKHAY